MENNQNKNLVLIQDLGMQYPTIYSKQKKRYGLYKCFCNNEFKAMVCHIKTNKIKNCGCDPFRHNLSGHRIYGVWSNMIQRCANPKNKMYPYYGGRGITVSERWLDVKTFIDDMYPSYQEGLSIDRINNDLGYSLDNCRWTNKSTQSRNTRLIHSTNKSGYRGVCWSKTKNKWASTITIKNKTKHLGYFSSAINAAKVRDKYIDDNNLEHTKNF